MIYFENIDELMVFAKFTAFILGDRSMNLTDADKEIAVKMLKRSVNQRMDINGAKKEQLKALIDICSKLQ